MKRIIIIDGGPRKTMNTAAMVDAFAKGARSASKEIEVKHIRLYNLDYKGCVSCLACKVKDSKYTSFCAYNDGITEILKEAAFADGILFASPLYFGDITAQTRAFMERLFFPWLSYNEYSTHAPKRVPTAFIYTMNATEEYMPQLESAFERIESLATMFLQKPERIMALNTTQVKDYSRYDMAAFPAEGKRMWREAHWEKDLQSSFDAGRQMADKILTA
ncbi:MAG: flavodoxin family protein [Tannerella sp.]|nr:flavodoxin family protein [Tannerella sp.]